MDFHPLNRKVQARWCGNHQDLVIWNLSTLKFQRNFCRCSWVISSSICFEFSTVEDLPLGAKEGLLHNTIPFGYSSNATVEMSLKFISNFQIPLIFGPFEMAQKWHTDVWLHPINFECIFPHRRYIFYQDVLLRK